MKNDSIIRILIKSVIIIYFSSLVAVILAFLFGNSALWYLKYTIGVIVGGISFLLRIRFYNMYLSILVGMLAFSVALLSDSVEYLFYMDPPINPSLLYIKSFSSPLMWIVFTLFVVLPAYYLSSGRFENMVSKQLK